MMINNILHDLIKRYHNTFIKMSQGTQSAHRVYTCPQCGIVDVNDECIMCPKCNTPLTYVYERDD